MQKQPEKPDSVRDDFNLIYTVATVYAMCVLPFLRTGFGAQAFGTNGVVAAVFMFLATGFMKSTAMLHFLGIWFIALICQRIIGAVSRFRGGGYVHSRYQGNPILARLPWVNANAARAVLEPVATFWAAVVIGVVAPPLAEFLIGAAVSLVLKNMIDVEIDRARLRRMRDAQIEQTYLSRRLHEGD
jgi:hypothetical protein